MSSRYILFDQTGDRGKIMLGPDIFCEFPSNGNGNTMEPQVQHVYGEAFTALQTMRDSRSISVTLCRLQDELIVSKNSAEVAFVTEASKLSWNDNVDAAVENSSNTHEDTKDLEALLYSEDEESSTGHSPSEVTFDQDDDDEDDMLEISSAGFGASNTAAAAAAAAASINHKNFDRFDHFDHHKSSSNAALIGRKSGYLSVRKTARKAKIRQTVKLLQSIVPGGDSLDPSMILEQAINYMKSLQMKVLELEASRSSYHQQDSDGTGC